MFLIIDNYDSFVYNLVRYMEEIGEKVIIKLNDEIIIKDIEALKPDGIIISPGPKKPKDSKVSQDVVKYLAGTIPILGICLGHQVIAEAYGADIIKGERPMHGKLSKIYHNESNLYKGINNPFSATRYHSLVVGEKDFPKVLEVTSRTIDGTIMGIRHKIFDIEGVQFHPEAVLTEFGHEILKNFVKRCRK